MNLYNRKISVIGLGYVGLPVAASFAKINDKVVAFDINKKRIQDLKNCIDITGEVHDLEDIIPKLILTTDPADLKQADFHIITVPTPITSNHQPDLYPLISASRTVASQLKPGDIVVYESTVYPGATEEDCIPILENVSGLTCGKDFFVGYSPERINPGDKEHRFETITKVVSATDKNTLDIVARVYGSAIKSGIHKASSIKVAEAAKVIENTQRDINIALMNELALIFDRMNIRTKDVLAAAGTKWNFLPFTPGLVGGHCIGVDPYYLTAKAERLGYHPQVILSGRRINDSIGAFIAQRLIKFLSNLDVPLKRVRVGVLGLTFKENVPDLRNSRVPDIITELKNYGLIPIVHDPVADELEAREEYNITFSDLNEFRNLDAVILAVPHSSYIISNRPVLQFVKETGVLIDVKSALEPEDVPHSINYWSL